MKTLINKKAQETTSMSKLVTIILVLLAIALALWAAYELGLVDKFKNWADFNTTVQKEIEIQKNSEMPVPVLKLYFKVEGLNDDFYFIKDVSTKSSLRVYVNIALRSCKGWLSNPNECDNFKNGKGITSETQTIIRDIMAQDGLDKSLEKIFEASKKEYIDASWGNYATQADMIDHPSSPKIFGDRDPADVPFLKILFKEAKS